MVNMVSLLIANLNITHTLSNPPGYNFLHPLIFTFNSYLILFNLFNQMFCQTIKNKINQFWLIYKKILQIHPNFLLLWAFFLSLSLLSSFFSNQYLMSLMSLYSVASVPLNFFSAAAACDDSLSALSIVFLLLLLSLPKLFSFCPFS